jgi:hypothetical protein
MVFSVKGTMPHATSRMNGLVAKHFWKNWKARKQTIELEHLRRLVLAD